MKTEDTEALGRQRAKPTKQDQSPIQLTDLCLYNSTQYCSIETVFSIFPFLQTNITSQMWPTGGKGGFMLVECRMTETGSRDDKEYLCSLVHVKYSL